MGSRRDFDMILERGSDWELYMLGVTRTPRICSIRISFSAFSVIWFKLHRNINVKHTVLSKGGLKFLEATSLRPIPTSNNTSST
jgi:hypothetical protein